MICLGVFLLGSHIFRTLWASWTSWECTSVARLGKFSFIFFSKKFSISCSSSSLSGIPMIQILECLKLSQRFLSLSSFFLSSCVFILFRLNVCFFLLFQIVDLSPGFLLFTVGSLYIFLYCTLYTLPFFLNFATILNHFCEHPITSVLNCASDRLAISSSLRSFPGVLICSSSWAIFLFLSTPVML